MRVRGSLARVSVSATIVAVTVAASLCSPAASAAGGVLVPGRAPTGWIKAPVLLPAHSGPSSPYAVSATARRARPALRRSPSYLAAKQAAESSLTGAGKRIVALSHSSSVLGHAAATAPSLFLGPVFGGLDQNQSGGFVPPDVQLAVSPGFIVEVVNGAFEIFPRNGGGPRIAPLTSVFNGNPDDLTDPQLSFDALAGRFIAGIMDDKRSVIEIAVSNGADPGGSWKVIEFPFGTDTCPDQPKLGYDDQIIAFSVNLFRGGGCAGTAGNSVGTLLVVLSKSQMLDPAAGLPPDQSFFDARSSKIVPARSLSSTAIDYMVSVNSDEARVLHVFPYVGVPPTGGFHGAFDVPVAKLNDPPAARQRGTSEVLDTNDNRITDAAWRGDRLFAAANDGCKFSQDRREHSCARVMSVSTVTHRTLLQDDLGFVGEDAYYPALDPDVANNLDVVIGFSSPKEYPSLGFIGYTRHGYTDVQTVAGGTVPITNADPSTRNDAQRLGDYFGAEVDPLNPNVVWAAGEYARRRHDWGTEIGSMSLVKSALPNRPPLPAPARASAKYGGTTSQHDAISFQASADGYHLVRAAYAIEHRCARGYVDSLSASALSRQDTVSIAPDGTFSFTVDGGADSFQRSGTVTINGRFRGGTVSGTLSSTENSRRHGTCRSGTVRWSAHN